MRAYMRDKFPFLGIPSTQRRALQRQVLAGLPAPDPEDLRAVAEICWGWPEREFQYCACDLLIRRVRLLPAEFCDVVRQLLVTKSWWDTVDPLATRVVGGLVARHPTLVAVMDEWSQSENVWLVRAALLHQLHYRDDTDVDRLFRYCAAQASHPDFFVRKAIGWALRQYAKTDPEAVRRFVSDHRDRLSALSVKEALRHQPAAAKGYARSGENRE